ncbi:protease modulator HflC [Enterovirga rhinocerotis]|uniref:Protein HflC n=1 Tax=Enterovirga rhinocerotis TaxID=1339210 RepID=A0A4R7BT80_9HYPH|nr:protease modulator HflC [Enterovirga rhinocerotis]TDR88112.1 protease FtsH subunit HflC [Enterovirga rhinocerotis]
MTALRTALLVLLAAVFLLLFSATFIVDQRQQALVLRFGAIRTVATQPGLYFKLPLFENVVYLDRRILDLNLPAQEVIASDQKRLVVDSFARYRILDPLRFYQTVNTIAGANNRLGAIVSSTVRGVLGDATFTDVVRTDREALMRTIRDRVNQAARGLGVEIVDVRLRRVDLPEQNSQAIFQRMQTERQREATDLRAQGTQIGQSIRARADRDVTVIVAEANQKSDELRGTGEAEKNRILAEAFGRDPDFFSFYRWMQTYESALKSGDTRMILSPTSEVLRYFKGPTAQSVAPAARAPAAAAAPTEPSSRP